MSAELYDAEMAGALARPAIDVLPTQHSRKGKEEVTAADPADVASPADIAMAAPAEGSAPVETPALEGLAAPAAPLEAAAAPAAMVLAADLADEPAPRKVFGLTLGRGKRSKASDEPVVTDEANAPEAVSDPVSELDELPSFAPEVVAPTFEPVDEPVAESAIEAPVGSLAEADAAPVAEITPEAAPVADHSDESRALRSLLDASEQVRQVAEQRTAAAEAQVRTLTNSVQEWQIRHREAESTITELAGSLAGAEGRMAELSQQLAAVQAERDELINQLDAATSPANS